jgi:hypothetical protein
MKEGHYVKMKGRCRGYAGQVRDVDLTWTRRFISQVVDKGHNQCLVSVFYIRSFFVLHFQPFHAILVFSSFCTYSLLIPYLYCLFDTRTLLIPPLYFFYSILVLCYPIILRFPYYTSIFLSHTHSHTIAHHNRTVIAWSIDAAQAGCSIGFASEAETLSHARANFCG